MGLNFPARPAAPDLNQPDSYNQRVLDGFTWNFQTMPDYLEGLSAEDFFQVQSSATDATAGKLLKVDTSQLGEKDAPTITDLNDLKGFGVRKFSSTAANKPPQMNDGIVAMLGQRDQNRRFQIAFDGGAGPVMAIRGQDAAASAWSGWAEVLTDSWVQSEAGDAAAGMIMLNGAHGLGGAAISLGSGDDLNSLTATGFYYNPSAANTTGNNYPVSKAGSLLNIRRSTSNWTQEYLTFPGTGEEPRLFIRSYGLAGWSAWREVYTAGSILGTVSQSGGVPTGAVIEYGSNGNGKYTRFADGTQICTHHFGVNGTTHNWTFPAAFVSTTAGSLALSAMPFGGSSAHVSVNWSPSATAAEFRTWAHDGTPLSTQLHATAIGRWF